MITRAERERWRRFDPKRLAILAALDAADALREALSTIVATDEDGALLISENIGDILRIAHPVLVRYDAAVEPRP